LFIDLLPRPSGPPDVVPDHRPAEGTLLGEAVAMGGEAAVAALRTLRQSSDASQRP
jgi:hypothetical protein